MIDREKQDDQPMDPPTNSGETAGTQSDSHNVTDPPEGNTTPSDI